VNFPSPDREGVVKNSVFVRSSRSGLVYSQSLRENIRSWLKFTRFRCGNAL